MGINENTKNLIDALAKNDTAKAKAYAQCIIAIQQPTTKVVGLRSSAS